MTLGINNDLKCKTPLTVLSIISLIFAVIGSIRYFIYYEYHLSDGNIHTELTASFPNISELLLFVFEFAPAVLMFLYIVFFYKRYKASALVSIACGLMALYPVIRNINSIIRYLDSELFSQSVFTKYFTNDYIIDFISNIVIDLAIIVACIFLTVSALKGFHKKVYAIVAVAIGILAKIFSLLMSFKLFGNYIKYETYLHFTYPVAIIGAISLYVTILLLALNNEVPALMSTKQKTKS